MNRLRLFFLLFALLAYGPLTYAPLENRDTLKTYFETGDIPTQDQFADLIDSFIDLRFEYGAGPDVHTVTALRGSIGVDGSGGALLLSEGEVFDPATRTLQATGSLGASSAWPGQSGFMPFVFEIDNGNNNFTTHNGFLQMSVDASGSATPYAIRLVAVGYETTPNTPVTMTSVPEPATVAVIALCGLMLSRRCRD